MAAGGTPSNVQLGPGRLWVGPIGTTEPTNASSALDAAFVAVGYTETGNVYSAQITTEPVEVAEELDPIRYVNTRRVQSVQFAMAEATLRNLRLSMNEGVQTTAAGETWEPQTDFDQLVRVMIVWDSLDTAAGDNTNVRWLFRQCFQVDAVEINHNKAPNKSLIPVRFQLEKPDSNTSVKVFSNASKLVA